MSRYWIMKVLNMIAKKKKGKTIEDSLKTTKEERCYMNTPFSTQTVIEIFSEAIANGIIESEKTFAGSELYPEEKQSGCYNGLHFETFTDDSVFNKVSFVKIKDEETGVILAIGGINNWNENREDNKSTTCLSYQKLEHSNFYVVQPNTFMSQYVLSTLNTLMELNGQQSREKELRQKEERDLEMKKNEEEMKYLYEKYQKKILNHA